MTLPHNTIPGRELLAITVNDALFQRYWFGPSMNTCRAFADQVLAEAAAIGIRTPTPLPDNTTRE